MEDMMEDMIEVKMSKDYYDMMNFMTKKMAQGLKRGYIESILHIGYSQTAEKIDGWHCVRCKMHKEDVETIISYGEKNKDSMTGILLKIGEYLGRLKNVNSMFFQEIVEAFEISEEDEEYEEDEEVAE